MYVRHKLSHGVINSVYPHQFALASLSFNPFPKFGVVLFGFYAHIIKIK